MTPISKLFLLAFLTGRALASEKQNNVRELIIGGSPVSDTGYRFFTALGACGASLIAPDMLLTAAHCPVPSGSFASVGYYSASDIVQTLPTQAGEKHPAYDPITLVYDFQIVQLQTPVNNIPVIPLNSNPNRPAAVGEIMVVLGLGDNNPGESQGSSVQIVGAVVNLEDNNECERNKGLGVSYSDSVYDSMLCAIRNRGDEPTQSGANACNGDNGGPLISAQFNNPSNPADYVGDLVGLVSWGYDACSKGNRFPRVYARVSSGFAWIRYKVCTESANPPAYLSCGANEVAPAVPLGPSPPAATNPIRFRYSITTNFFSYQNGIRIESVGDIPVTFQHVVPSALPNGATFTQTLELSEGELYAFTLTDSLGNGIESVTQPITLAIEQANGVFTTIRTIQPNFTGSSVTFFYATTTGTIANSFDQAKSFTGGIALTLTITLDEFPEEVSILLTSGTEEMWLRPFRFYANRAEATIIEQIPVPNEDRDYVLTVYDSGSDGIGSTSYAISYNGVNLVQDSFPDGRQKISTFSLLRVVIDTSRPTPTPVDPQPTPTIVDPQPIPEPTGAPTLSPNPPNENRSDPTASSALKSFAFGVMSTTVLSMVMSVFSNF